MDAKNRRGEIAIRIGTTARELGIHTIAIYTSEDANHAVYADEALLLDSPSDFTNVDKIVSIATKCKADSVHPGYGFLSESADFAVALQNAGVQFIGPNADILRRVSDKTDARALAIENGVPVLPASGTATSDIEDARSFASTAGFPVMIKAVDGGGGRGIRLVRSNSELRDSFNRARGESPSGQVFVEKAAVDGYRHVEVQILGDRTGRIAHLWERECSIQRRFQKIVEIAPSTIRDRHLVGKVIEDAMKMAKSVSTDSLTALRSNINDMQIQYYSLGTFEFLVHESRPEYYFLEVNPRLQVEHTISEEIAGTDIVQCQLRLAQGATIEELDLPTENELTNFPKQHAIQLRITAEDVSKGFTLSMGRITGFQAPGGPGVRVDTHLSSTKPTTVGSSYDSLLAKLILRSNTFEGARLKAIRALNDSVIAGVTTNLDILTGTVTSKAFEQGACSTTWLESNISEIMSTGNQGTLSSRETYITSTTTTESNLSTTAGLGTAGHLFRKGDAFKMELTSTARANDKSAQREEYLLRVDRVLTNNFPYQFTADVTFATSSTSQTYAMNLASTTQTSVASSRHRLAAANNATHIALPFPGQFVELLVDEGDQVWEGEVLCVVRQMKMELEVRAPWNGTVKWVCDVEDGETVNEGLLVCELQPEDDRNRRKIVGPFKL